MLPVSPQLYISIISATCHEPYFVTLLILPFAIVMAISPILKFLIGLALKVVSHLYYKVKFLFMDIV